MSKLESKKGAGAVVSSDLEGAICPQASGRGRMRASLPSSVLRVTKNC